LFWLKHLSLEGEEHQVGHALGMTLNCWGQLNLMLVRACDARV